MQKVVSFLAMQSGPYILHILSHDAILHMENVLADKRNATDTTAMKARDGYASYWHDA